MLSNNACILYDNHMEHFLMTKEEVLEMFGQDYLDDYGSYVPEELIKRYKELTQELKLVQKQLIKINEERLSK